MLGWLDGDAKIEGCTEGIDDCTPVKVGLVLGWLDGDAEIEVCVEGIDDGTPVEVGLVLGWLDGDAEIEVCVEGLDVFGSVGYCFIGDEDGVVGCGVDGRGDGGDGGRCGGSSSSSSSLQGGKRQDERRHEERRRKQLLLLSTQWLLHTRIRAAMVLRAGVLIGVSGEREEWVR